MKKWFLISLILLIGIGICVSRVKYEVSFLRNKLKLINKQIEKYEDDIKVCKAEWSYLNNPKRLESLRKKYLSEMVPMSNRQIISFEQLSKNNYVIIKHQSVDKISKNNSIKQTELSNKQSIINKAGNALDKLLSKTLEKN